MAVTITSKKQVVAGNARITYVDLTGPASYTTGGEALSAADIVKLAGGKPGAVIADILQFDAEPSTGGHSVVLDRTNSKVMFFNGTTQIAATTNLSGVTVRVAVTHSVVNG